MTPRTDAGRRKDKAWQERQVSLLCIAFRWMGMEGERHARPRASFSRTRFTLEECCSVGIAFVSCHLVLFASYNFIFCLIDSPHLPPRLVPGKQHHRTRGLRDQRAVPV